MGYRPYRASRRAELPRVPALPPIRTRRSQRLGRRAAGAATALRAGPADRGSGEAADDLPADGAAHPRPGVLPLPLQPRSALCRQQGRAVRAVFGESQFRRNLGHESALVGAEGSGEEVTIQIALGVVAGMTLIGGASFAGEAEVFDLNKALSGAGQGRRAVNLSLVKTAEDTGDGGALKEENPVDPQRGGSDGR